MHALRKLIIAADAADGDSSDHLGKVCKNVRKELEDDGNGAFEVKTCFIRFGKTMRNMGTIQIKPEGENGWTTVKVID